MSEVEIKEVKVKKTAYDYNKAWRQLNKDKKSEQDRRYREKHPEKFREYAKKQYEKKKIEAEKNPKPKKEKQPKEPKPTFYPRKAPQTIDECENALKYYLKMKEKIQNNNNKSPINENKKFLDEILLEVF